MRDDLDDPLEELFQAAAAGTSAPRPAPPAHYQAPTYTENCRKCGGSGRFVRGRFSGQCFECKGKGTFTFKTSPKARNDAKFARENRDDRKRTEAIETFKAAQPEVYAWILAETPRFEFAAKMLEAICRYGSLTEGQLNACLRGVERNKQRQVERTARVEAAPVIEATRIHEAFDKAINAKRLRNQLGVKSIQLRLDTFIFKPARKDPSIVYVTDATETGVDGDPLYLGKILHGRFQATRVCGEAKAAAIVAAAADPAKAAVAYGKRFGACSCCGLTLTDPESIERGIGPVCSAKYGF